MVSRSHLVLCLLAFSIAGSAATSDARPARPAPALPAPTGAIVNVGTEVQLQAAVRTLTSNTTIVIAPGTYVLTSSLYVRGVTNVGIRGATNDSDDVVLVGPGMSQANYGSVPFGIWAGLGVDGITIANLTIRDLYFHPIIFNDGAENPRVYTVHLIDAGEQFIKVNPDGRGGGVDNGIVEYSVIEFTTTGRSDYPKGVDIQTAQNWIVRHNLFRNLVPPSGALSGPGVLVWRGSSNTTVEGNSFVNCTRGVMLGADDYYSPSQRGGVIRNNLIYRSASQAGDVGIILSDSPDTQVLNNTVYLSGTYGSPIEYRYPGTRNTVITNNLVDGAIASRDRGTATLATNLQGVGPGNFVSAATGDLHLSALAVSAIDQGTAIGAVLDDYDGQARPQGSGYDIGADERAASTVTYRIGGRVTDASGTGVPGVTLTLSGGQSRAASSDASGAYAFTGLAAGSPYTITPAKSGLTFTPPHLYDAALTRDQGSADFAATVPSGASAAAAFVKSDSTTRGNWIGSYGGDGSAIVGTASALPSYASVAVTAAASWTWAFSSGDSRAPQKPGGDRVAACWYSSTGYTIDVNLTDGGAHQVAMYLLDWDGWGRSLRAEVVDAASGAVLDTRQASGFQSGQYLVWSLSGHVLLRVTNTGPQNAVVTALFFGPAGTTTPPSSTGASATFTRSDDTTTGNWTGVYGSKGYALAGDAVLLPSWAPTTIGGASTWTWSWSTADMRAVRRPDGASRLAACWYADNAMTIDMDLQDGARHAVALYVLDWDPWGRAQRVDVLDAATGAVLDTRSITAFAGGRYLVWTVSGHVRFRVVNAGYPNVVVSGVFID
ncbi:MAG: right-handed parallel beta-helix repeat-containing protein [Vicinamibacterales bacterium]